MGASRLKALEKCLPDETKPPKVLLLEWLVQELRQQGIRFDVAGLPDKSSIEEKVPERIGRAGLQDRLRVIDLPIGGHRAPPPAVVEP